MIQPRFIRLVDAAGYLGMDKNRFNAEVRPVLTEIPMGVQGIAFDRHDLDNWADDYKANKGRPCRKKPPVLLKEAQPGSSIRKSAVSDFTKALDAVKKQKRSGTITAASTK